MCAGPGIPVGVVGNPLIFEYAYRFQSSQRKTIYGRYSSALAESRVSSLPRTGIQVKQKDLRSSASKSGAMLQRPVRKSMAVSVTRPKHSANKSILEF